MPEMTHDGPATPEQISLFIPLTYSATRTNTMRYKRTADAVWTTGHPLHQINHLWVSDAPDDVQEGLAWTILDLTPGVSYDVEVSVVDGGDPVVYTGTFVTRTLPLPASTDPADITTVADASLLHAAIDASSPGDILELAEGTYNMSGAIQIDKGGSAGNPLYIRGKSRTGTVIHYSGGNVIAFVGSTPITDVIIENLTLTGSGTDDHLSGTTSFGIKFTTENTFQRITIRNCSITGVDRCIIIGDVDGNSEFLVYDNILSGNNTWTGDIVHYDGVWVAGSDSIPDIDGGSSWNDHGVAIGGKGNCAFNNSISGFGDSFCLAHSYRSYEQVGCHFYRNDISVSCDDAFESDHATRNVTFYDNRIHNSMTLISCDPTYGGPIICARNVAINVGRQVYKLNEIDTGTFIYNNTVVRAFRQNSWVEPEDYYGFGMYLPTSAALQRGWAYQNNILINGDGNTPDVAIKIAPTTYAPLDFGNNCWYPDGEFKWGNNPLDYSLSEAQTDLPAAASYFSAYTKPHENDAICDANPFGTAIVFGADYHTEITARYIPILANATVPKNAGTAIVGITDNFSGAAPDMGAIITGKVRQTWGDRSTENSDLTPILAGHAKDLGAYQGPQRELTDYSHFVYDPDTYCMLLWGSGHNYLYDNVDRLSLAQNAPFALAWNADYARTPNDEMIVANILATGNWSTTGYPISRHSYDLLEYHPVLRRMFMLSTHGVSNDWTWTTYVTDARFQSYDPWAKLWSIATAGLTESDPALFSCAYDPISGLFLIVSQAHMRSYDPVTETVVDFKTFSDPGFSSSFVLVYYPPTDKFLLFTNTSPRKVYEITLVRTGDWSDSSITGNPLSTTGAPNYTNPSWGMAYDSQNQVMGGVVAGGHFYIFNPATNAWSDIVMSSDAGAIGTMAYNCIGYDPINNVFIFITTSASGGRTWAYRYMGSSTAIPNPPTTLRIVR